VTKRGGDVVNGRTYSFNNKKNNKKQHPLLINKYNPSLIKINLIVLFNVM
jgi:hypothetical protein